MPLPVNTNQSEFLPNLPDESARIRCLISGGSWDAEKKTCTAGATPLNPENQPVCITRARHSELEDRPTKTAVYAWAAGGLALGFLLGSWK
jgi:hypothetical protein